MDDFKETFDIIVDALHTLNDEEEDGESYDDDLSSDLESAEIITTTIDPDKQYESINKYWQNYGFHSVFTYVQSGGSSMSLDEAVNLIKRVNSRFFNESPLRKMTATWTVDGLSACGKTSTYKDTIIRKSNNHMALIAHNTHPSSHIGYSFTQLKMQMNNAHSIWDRNAFNNYVWLKIWSCISYAHKFKCERVPLNVMRRVFDELNSDTIRFFGDAAANIIVVDSNEESARSRLAQRNENSDLHRSNWLYYQQVQNYFYARLTHDFPDKFCLIDINWFDGSLHLMQNVIRCLIESESITVNDSFAPPLFEPLVCDVKKGFLKYEYEKYERMRPIQTLSFTHGAKRLLEFK